MNGREFLDSSKRLVARGHAADTRSAISRAYYAAFHAVRDFFSDCGIRFSEHSPEAHAKTSQCLDNSNVQMAIELGGQLRSLREDRNGSDYRMNDLQFQSATNAQLRIKIAEGIIASVDALATEPDRTNMRKLLRPKPRQLGLDVVGND